MVKSFNDVECNVYVDLVLNIEFFLVFFKILGIYLNSD